MANIKVSELTEATAFNDGDYTMIVQSNQNKKILKENMLDDLAIVGDLGNLSTPSKTNVVNAINSIIESGSNENGGYIKLYDGTMICYKTVSGNTGEAFSLWSNGIYFYEVSNGTWAQEFTQIDNVQISSLTNQIWCIIFDTTTTSAGQTRLLRPNDGGSSGQNYNINIIAIGKWK